MITRLTLPALFSALLISLASAATPAADNSSNYPGGVWADGSNGGTGFGAWSFGTGGPAGSNAGRYIGGTGESASSFGLYAAEASTFSTADRPFTGALVNGNAFTMNLGATGVAAGGTIGINLLSAGNVVFTFKFTGGNNFWQLNDGGTDFDTNIPFAANTPLSFSFAYNGGSTYSVLITEGATTYSGPNYVANSVINNITSARFFSAAQGGNENFGFDNLAVVPEPSSVALLAGPMLLGAWFFVRRRRA